VKKYLVVSADSSDDELFLDYVVADSREKAKAFIGDVRGELTDGHLALDQGLGCVLSSKDLRRMANTLDELSIACWSR